MSPETTKFKQIKTWASLQISERKQEQISDCNLEKETRLKPKHTNTNKDHENPRLKLIKEYYYYLGFIYIQGEEREREARERLSSLVCFVFMCWPLMVFLLFVSIASKKNLAIPRG